MKTFFEGFINGEKFDSVEEYNKIVSKLIEKNVAFEASTSTRQVFDESDNDIKVPVPGSPVALYPGFDENWKDFELDNYDYVYSYISPIKTDYEDNLNGLKLELENNLKDIIWALDEMDFEGLKDYDDGLIDIENNILDDIKYANQSLEVLNIWKDFYSSVRTAVKDKLKLHITTSNPENIDELICPDDTDFKDTQESMENVAAELETTLLNAMSKLASYFNRKK